MKVWKPEPKKIIQILLTPNDSRWQGHLLGLDNYGSVYMLVNGFWEPCIAPLTSLSSNQEES